MPTKGFEHINDILETNVNRTNHILVIAIDDYVHCPKLNNAVKDVDDFIKLMLGKFEFEEENVTFLKNEVATKSNIFKHLRHLIKSLSANDNLVIYFSGHGEFDDVEEEGYWITQEVRQGAYSDYLPNSRIKKLISKIKAHHIFLISDSCFSGALFDRNIRLPHEIYEKDASRWGLTSGRNEIVTDGKPGENSPFAKSLLYALRNTTGPIPILTLCQKVQNDTTINSKQSPRFERIDDSGHRGGQFVFRLKKDEKRDWAKAEKINAKTVYEQFVVLYPDGKFTEIAKAKINVINDEATWKYACRLNQENAYARYISKFPNGKYRQEAEQKIKILGEDKYWERTMSYDNYIAYSEYLRLYPNGRYVIVAQQAIDTILNIDDVWEKVVAENTIKSYEEFVEQHPESTFVVEAKQNVLLLSKMAQAEKERLAKAAEAKVKAEQDRIKQERLAAEQQRKAKKQAKIERLSKENLRKAQAEKNRIRQQKAAEQLESERNRKAKEKKQQKESQPTLLQRIPTQYKRIGIAAFTLILIVGIWEISKISNDGIASKTPQINLNVPIDDLMVKVEGGIFQMGSNDDEKPIHKVTVPTFYISKYQVTQKQWQEIMGNNPSHFNDCKNCPVEQVSWDDIQEFIKKLNKKTNQKYRLPAEAEWEFAARGGNKSKNYKYAGSDNIDEVAWYRENSNDKTHSVGTKTSNELGIYDMSGNVWEWCEDVWHDNYKNAPNNGSAWIDKDADKSLYRVRRGGSYFNNSDFCRSAYRDYFHPTGRYFDVGFRLVFQVQ
jgi:formylglycine-generating enzyme required for sulfatase activity